MPKDAKRQKKLQEILQRRKDEIQFYHQEHPAQHPHFRERVLARQICEVAILEKLMNSKRVIGWDLSQEIMEKRQKEDAGSMRTFYYAWGDAWDAVAALVET